MTDADRAKAAELVLWVVYESGGQEQAVDAIAAALAEARAPYDRLTADLRALVEEWEAEARAARDRAEHMDRTEENVRHHKAEMRHARVAHHAAAGLRAVITGSEEADAQPSQTDPGTLRVPEYTADDSDLLDTALEGDRP